MAKPECALDNFPGLEGLFRPLTIGSTTLPNRFVMPAMQRGWCNGGAPTARLGEYYRRRVIGGVGLIVTESCAVDHVSATQQPAAARMTRATLEAWRRCLAPARDAGGTVIVQLWHEGALRNADDGFTLSASGTAYAGHHNGRAATGAEIEQLVDAFAAAAVLARDAGANGVEVHGAHGYMLDQFLWATTNVREDGHGGPDIADRARFPADIVTAIRNACGPDFIVSFRFSQWKEHDYMARIVETPDQLATLATTIRDAGADMLHVSTRRFWEAEWPDDSRSLAGWTRSLAGLPTIAVGSVGLDRDVMESFLRETEADNRIAWSLAMLGQGFLAGEFDMIAIGRSLIADPDWVNKVMASDIAAIRTFRKSDMGELEWEA